MPQITITGEARTMDGVLLPSKTIILRRTPALPLPDGAVFRLPEPVIITSDGAGLVSFTIASGLYVGEVSTATGVVRFAFNIPEAPSTATFSDCLQAIDASAYDLMLQTMAGLGLRFYSVATIPTADPSVPFNTAYLAPHVPSGITLGVWQKINVGGGIANEAYRGPAFPQGFIPVGSAALPGLSVAGDTDTGLFSPGLNRLAIATGGGVPLELNAAGAILNGLLSGTAVTQTRLDTTAGRLLKVGDFGFGGGLSAGLETFLADADSINSGAGMFQTTTGTVGTFPAGENKFGMMLLMRYNSTNFVQIWMSVLSDTLYTRRYRSTDSPAFSPWRPLFSRQNLLGTVSQTAGVPTGAVIERGSNANGGYVRFADGTQRCTRTNLSAANANTALGSLFRSADVTWTYPAAFAAAPVVTGDVDDADAWLATSGAPGTSSAAVRVLSAVTKATALNCRVVATGRWF
jgi:hypothetical protein